MDPNLDTQVIHWPDRILADFKQHLSSTTGDVYKGLKRNRFATTPGNGSFASNFLSNLITTGEQETVYSSNWITKIQEEMTRIASTGNSDVVIIMQTLDKFVRKVAFQYNFPAITDYAQAMSASNLHSGRGPKKPQTSLVEAYKNTDPMLDLSIDNGLLKNIGAFMSVLYLSVLHEKRLPDHVIQSIFTDRYVQRLPLTFISWTDINCLCIDNTHAYYFHRTKPQGMEYKDRRLTVFNLRIDREIDLTKDHVTVKLGNSGNIGLALEIMKNETRRIWYIESPDMAVNFPIKGNPTNIISSDTKGLFFLVSKDKKIVQCKISSKGVTVMQEMVSGRDPISGTIFCDIGSYYSDEDNICGYSIDALIHKQMQTLRRELEDNSQLLTLMDTLECRMAECFTLQHKHVYNYSEIDSLLTFGDWLMTELTPLNTQMLKLVCFMICVGFCEQKLLLENDIIDRAREFYWNVFSRSLTFQNWVMTCVTLMIPLCFSCDDAMKYMDAIKGDEARMLIHNQSYIPLMMFGTSAAYYFLTNDATERLRKSYPTSITYAKLTALILGATAEIRVHRFRNNDYIERTRLSLLDLVTPGIKKGILTLLSYVTVTDRYRQSSLEFGKVMLDKLAKQKKGKIRMTDLDPREAQAVVSIVLVISNNILERFQQVPYDEKNELGMILDTTIPMESKKREMRSDSEIALAKEVEAFLTDMATGVTNEMIERFSAYMIQRVKEPSEKNLDDHLRTIRIRFAAVLFKHINAGMDAIKMAKDICTGQKPAIPIIVRQIWQQGNRLMRELKVMKQTVENFDERVHVLEEKCVFLILREPMVNRQREIMANPSIMFQRILKFITNHEELLNVKDFEAVREKKRATRTAILKEHSWLLSILDDHIGSIPTYVMRNEISSIMNQTELAVLNPEVMSSMTSVLSGIIVDAVNSFVNLKHEDVLGNWSLWYTLKPKFGNVLTQPQKSYITKTLLHFVRTCSNSDMKSFAWCLITYITMHSDETIMDVLMHAGMDDFKEMVALQVLLIQTHKWMAVGLNDPFAKGIPWDLRSVITKSTMEIVFIRGFPQGVDPIDTVKKWLKYINVMLYTDDEMDLISNYWHRQEFARYLINGLARLVFDVRSIDRVKILGIFKSLIMEASYGDTLTMSALTILGLSGHRKTRLYGELHPENLALDEKCMTRIATMLRELKDDFFGAALVRFVAWILQYDVSLRKFIDTIDMELIISELDKRARLTRLEESPLDVHFSDILRTRVISDTPTWKKVTLQSEPVQLKNRGSGMLFYQFCHPQYDLFDTCAVEIDVTTRMGLNIYAGFISLGTGRNTVFKWVDFHGRSVKINNVTYTCASDVIKRQSKSGTVYLRLNKNEFEVVRKFSTGEMISMVLDNSPDYPDKVIPIIALDDDMTASVRYLSDEEFTAITESADRSNKLSWKTDTSNVMRIFIPPGSILKRMVFPYIVSKAKSGMLGVQYELESINDTKTMRLADVNHMSVSRWHCIDSYDVLTQQSKYNIAVYIQRTLRHIMTTLTLIGHVAIPDDRLKKLLLEMICEMNPLACFDRNREDTRLCTAIENRLSRRDNIIDKEVSELVFNVCKRLNNTKSEPLGFYMKCGSFCYTRHLHWKHSVGVSVSYRYGRDTEMPWSIRYMSDQYKYVEITESSASINASTWIVSFDNYYGPNKWTASLQPLYGRYVDLDSLSAFTIFVDMVLNSSKLIKLSHVDQLKELLLFACRADRNMYTLRQSVLSAVFDLASTQMNYHDISEITRTAFTSVKVFDVCGSEDNLRFSLLAAVLRQRRNQCTGECCNDDIIESFNSLFDSKLESEGVVRAIDIINGYRHPKEVHTCAYWATLGDLSESQIIIGLEPGDHVIPIFTGYSTIEIDADSNIHLIDYIIGDKNGVTRKRNGIRLNGEGTTHYLSVSNTTKERMYLTITFGLIADCYYKDDPIDPGLKYLIRETGKWLSSEFSIDMDAYIMERESVRYSVTKHGSLRAIKLRTLMMKKARSILRLFLEHENENIRSIMKEATVVLYTADRMKPLQMYLEEVDESSHPRIRFDRVNADQDITGARSCSLLMQLQQQMELDDVKSLIHYQSARGPWVITLAGEDGVDAGGVSRDVFGRVCDELMRPNMGIFTLTPNGIYKEGDNQAVLIPAKNALENDLEWVGVFIAVSITAALPQRFSFPVFIWRFLLGGEITVDDICSIDTVFHSFVRNDNIIPDIRSLVDVWNNPVPLNINMERKTLMLRWAEIQIKDMTKKLTPIRNGFYRILTEKSVSLLLPADLRFLSCGSQFISAEKLLSVIEYNEGSEHIRPLIVAAVNELTPMERSDMLEFVCGVRSFPPSGFTQPIIVISVVSMKTLPVAHTCFMQLDIKNYTSVDEFLKDIRICFEWGMGSFEIA